MIGRTLIIEFVGLPGAGKSYLAARVADALAERGMRVWQYEDRPGPRPMSGQWLFARCKALWLAVTRPRVTWRLWQAARRTARPAHFMIMWWAFLIMRARERHKHDVLIFDQAIAQLIWSINYEAGPSVAAALAAIAPRPHLLVCVHATLETVQRRLGRRDGAQSTLERDMPGDATAGSRAEAAMSAIAQATGDWMRVDVNHDDDTATDACAHAIVAAAERQRREAN